MIDKWTAAARRNVEANLGNVVTEEHSEDDVGEEIYTLALDGAMDAGADWDSASNIAVSVAEGQYAVQ